MIAEFILLYVVTAAWVFWVIATDRLGERPPFHLAVLIAGTWPILFMLSALTWFQDRRHA
jgi:hypothetical protein